MGLEMKQKAITSLPRLGNTYFKDMDEAFIFSRVLGPLYDGFEAKIDASDLALMEFDLIGIGVDKDTHEYRQMVQRMFNEFVNPQEPK